MIEFRSNKPEFKFLVNGKVEISFQTNKSILKDFDNIKDDKELVVQVKEYRQKRSLSQNAYMWVLLDEIGKAVNRSKAFQEDFCPEALVITNDSMTIKAIIPITQHRNMKNEVEE